MYLRDDANHRFEAMRALVPVTGGPEDHIALNVAADLVTVGGGKLTALYVQPETDAVAWLVGKKNLRRIVESALEHKSIEVDHEVILAEDLVKGINQAGAEKYDFVPVWNAVPSRDPARRVCREFSNISRGIGAGGGHHPRWDAADQPRGDANPAPRKALYTTTRPSASNQRRRHRNVGIAMEF